MRCGVSDCNEQSIGMCDDFRCFDARIQSQYVGFFLSIASPRLIYIPYHFTKYILLHMHWRAKAKRNVHIISHFLICWHCITYTLATVLRTRLSASHRSSVHCHFHTAYNILLIRNFIENAFWICCVFFFFFLFILFLFSVHVSCRVYFEPSNEDWKDTFTFNQTKITRIIFVTCESTLAHTHTQSSTTAYGMKHV